MPRGGKRPGAGRKPRLTELERLRVGALCERLHRNERQAALSEDIREATYNVQDEFNDGIISQIPLSKRKEFAESEIGQIFQDEVRFALALDQGLSPEEAEEAHPPRQLHVSSRRPKGVRREIISAVAESLSIPEWLVDECWQDFRWYQKDAGDPEPR
jgi:hypothetical protein